MDYNLRLVTTRSMMKRDLQHSSASVPPFHNSTCVIDTTGHPTTYSNLLTDSTLPPPDLIDRCLSSDSSSERDASSFLFSEENFEISNLYNFEKSHSVTLVQHCTHNLDSPDDFKMESYCFDHCSCDKVMSSAVSTSDSVENDNSSDQDRILQMLQLISNQMDTLDRDFQDKLALTELKFIRELHRITQENETCRCEMKNFNLVMLLY